MSGALAELLADALSRAPPLRSTAGERLEASAIREMAARIAGRLRDRGLAPDEPVLVAIRNRPADLGALLGAWQAGAVAVPIAESAAETTSQSLRQATGARFEVDGRAMADDGRAMADDGEAVREIASLPPPSRPLLRGAALIVFTSGSTGQPKGVVIGHARLSAKLDVLQRLLGFRADDAVVVPLRLTFIFGIWVSLLALHAGAKLTLLPRFSAEVVSRALEEGGTVLAAVPSMLRTLLSAAPGPAPSLRSILAGGETLGAALADALRQAFPAAGLYDLYGLTETGSCDFCLAPSDQPEGLGTIGSPTAGIEFRLVGEDGHEVPEGAPGELGIRTPFGMLGYLNEPGFGTATDGFFRTGDIARRRPDGRVALVGRAKEIVIRGGNKIAPLELDTLLASHPEVAAALCAGVPDARLGEAIHAVVVPKPCANLTPEALREWAAARIERFKLPDTIHFRDALPVGPTGKASRSAVTEIAAACAKS